jgi:hypothetical protein
MKVHEFDAVVGGGEGRLPLVELPFDVKAAYGTARPKVKATVNDVTLRTTVSVYGGRSYVGFRKQIQEAAGIRIGIGSGPDRARRRASQDRGARRPGPGAQEGSSGEPSVRGPLVTHTNPAGQPSAGA